MCSCAAAQKTLEKLNEYERSCLTHSFQAWHAAHKKVIISLLSKWFTPATLRCHFSSTRQADQLFVRSYIRRIRFHFIFRDGVILTHG